jgi:hypothetical protein
VIRLEKDRIIQDIDICYNQTRTYRSVIVRGRIGVVLMRWIMRAVGEITTLSVVS